MQKLIDRFSYEYHLFYIYLDPHFIGVRSTMPEFKLRLFRFYYLNVHLI